MFSDLEIMNCVRTAPHRAFAQLGNEERAAWLKYVVETDNNPKARHPDLLWYGVVARAMCELAESGVPDDFSGEVVKIALTNRLAANVPLFTDAGEPTEWGGQKMSIAQLNFCHRVQALCAKDAAGAPAAPAASGHGELKAALSTLVSIHTESLQKNKPKGLSFDMSKRLEEIGLDTLPADLMPSEETLARWEALTKVAASKDRPYAGSSDGESLRVHHRPPWSRCPVVDVPVGEGTQEEKMQRSSQAAKAAS